MTSAAQLETILQYLRRKYYAESEGANRATYIAALKTRADTLLTAGTDQVAITGTSSEAGGAAQGEVTFDPLVYLQAIETLLLEVDDSAEPPPPSGVIVDFSQRSVAL